MSARTLGLALLFGAIYFIQGIADPTEGLVAQPVRSLLKSWGRGDGEIAAFVAILGAPWCLKPLFGLLTDGVPLAGSRRKSYLVLGAFAASVGFGVLGFYPWATEDHPGRLLAGLLIPTMAVAMTDVVADALMIEVGRPRGLVGRLQSVQWAGLYAAALLAGTLGGRLSESGRQRAAFLTCAGLSVAALILSAGFVRETRSTIPAVRTPVLLASWRAVRSPSFLGVAGFLFLWNFNPFSNAVLYLHLSRGLGLDERACGDNATAFAAACLAATLIYGACCRRVPIPVLVRLSVPLGVASNLAYWGLADADSLLPVTIFAGFTYMIATMIQLDLAARACPPEAAGTAFATLMAAENLAASASIGLGGAWYELWTRVVGHRAAFRALVALGAAFTMGCWFLIPLTDRALEEPVGVEAGDRDEGGGVPVPDDPPPRPPI